MNHPATISLSRQRSPRPRVKNILVDFLSEAGITVNGSAPWDIQIHNEQFYSRVLQYGSLGAGEAYMDGWWDVEQLDEFFYRILKANIDRKLSGHHKLRLLFSAIKYRLFNLQTKSRAWQVGEQHYDTGNDLFEIMLDSSMTYSCAYWKDAETLAQAQQNKLDLICRKLQLQAGEKLLDIGCGWGGLAEYAARHYHVEVTGVTISKEQCALAKQRCSDLPVTILLQDYRDLLGQFDKIVSVGMFEHVGPKNYSTYFDTARRLMKKDGLFLLHTIGEYSDTVHADPWIQKYIFPNGKIPSAASIVNSVKNRFLIEDWHNFGPDYDRTLMAWWENFREGWPALKNKYGQRFYRMWKYYLLACAGMFRSREGQLWQIVLSKPDNNTVYRSVR